MTKHDEHMNFYRRLEVDFDRSKEDLWAEIEKQTTKKPVSRSIIPLWVRYAGAAAILLVAASSLFMRLYTRTIHAYKGEQVSHTFPCGSAADLNAESTLSYHPYWWRFNRDLNFSGEGFFEVEKGKAFTVLSDEGITEVLGTSFNIYARKNEYEVFCKTGKVKVSSTKVDIKFEVEPGQIAIIDNLRKEGSRLKSSEHNSVAWKENKFNFADEPLMNVIEELERKFDIEITIGDNRIKGYRFTGYFEIPGTPEETIEMICSSFGLEYQKTDKRKYWISH